MVRTKRWKFTLWKYSNVGQPELSQQSLGNFPLVQEMCTIPELGGSGRKRRGMEQEGFFFSLLIFELLSAYIIGITPSRQDPATHVMWSKGKLTRLWVYMVFVLIHLPIHGNRQVCLKGNQIKPNQVKFSIFLEGISNSFLKSLNFLSLAFKPIQ